MKKLFISQPMNGRTGEAIRLEREKAIADATRRLNDQIIAVDSFDEDYHHRNEGPLWFLGRAIQVMSTADAAYFVDGWDQARGCKIEHACAEAYNIEIIKD